MERERGGKNTKIKPSLNSIPKNNTYCIVILPFIATAVSKMMFIIEKKKKSIPRANVYTQRYCNSVEEKTKRNSIFYTIHSFSTYMFITNYLISPKHNKFESERNKETKNSTQYTPNKKIIKLTAKTVIQTIRKPLEMLCNN